MTELSQQDAEIYERLLDIIVSETACKRCELNMSSEIDELGVVGFDCDCLLEAIQKEFDVDFSSFEFDRYCAPESMFDFTAGSRQPLYVEDLFRAAKNKVWTDRWPRKEKTYEEIRNEGIVKVGLWSIASVCLGLLLKRTIFK